MFDNIYIVGIFIVIMELDKAINLRSSVRKFKSKMPDWRDIIEAVDYARKAPLAGNIPSVQFILVDKPEIIAKLAEASQQDFVADAHFAVVVCSDRKNVVRSYDERGEIYSRQQAGAAIENFLLKITESGLSTCWVGDFVDEQVKYILRIPENIDVEGIFPIGYPFLKTAQKRKPSLDRCLYFNKYGNNRMKPFVEVEAH